MDIKLAVVSGAKATTIRIHRLPATIGRSGEASLRLPTTAVSRKHCEMFEIDGELFVRDLGSRNGTKVNKEKIDDAHALHTGDLMTVGPVTFQVFCPEKQDAADSMIDLDAEGAAAAPESGSMSRVNYRETPDGSFISIHDAEDEDELPAKPKRDEPARQAAVAKQAAEKKVAEKKKQPAAQSSKTAATDEVLGDFGEAAEEPVDSGDSALNDFFKHLG